MNLLTIQPTESPNEFVEYWQQFYNYRNESTYISVVSKTELSTEDILEIYRWKNNVGKDGKAMSRRKLQFVNTIQKRIAVVNALKKDFDLAKFKKEFGDLSAIWAILLLHIINPQEYPLYDRHVHRAFRFITSGINEKIAAEKRQQYEVYYNSYVPFFTNFFNKTNGFTKKKVDDALMMFGRFLSRYPIIIRD